MLRSVSDAGGQVFVVTHSPEVVRAFSPEDLVVLEEPAKDSSPRQLSKLLSAELRKRYENKLDRSVVRALFAAVPVLVEGPTDRVVLEVFLSRLVAEKKMPPPASLGIEFVSCEGWSEQDHMAGFLRAAGKRPVALVERDVDALDVLREGRHCSALLIHHDERPNLESALAHGAALEALLAGLEAVADDGEVQFDQRRAAVIAAAGTGSPNTAVRDATDLSGLFSALALEHPRDVIGSLLAHENGPFSIKSPRPARLFADALLAVGGVPTTFEIMLSKLVAWAAAPPETPGETVEIIME
jgi:putative ATP-dependent endonuclease of the OLD family